MSRIRPAVALTLLALTAPALLGSAASAQPVTVSRSSVLGSAAIDPTRRAEANDAFLTRMLPAVTMPQQLRKTGTGDCDPFHLSDASQGAARAAVNYVRALAGLAPVAFDEALSQKAAKAARERPGLPSNVSSGTSAG